MKILVVSSFLPYPLFSGGHVRLYNLLKVLSKKHTITLVCEKRGYQTERDIAEIKKFCKETIIIDRKKQWSPSTIFQTSLSSYPFLLVGHTVPEMKKKIVEVLQAERFDLIHIETFYVFQNLPKTYLPTVLVEHNIEYEVYKKFVEKAPVIARPLLMVDIEKIKYWEKRFWHQATKLIAVSEHEKKQMRRSDVTVVANGVDLSAFPFKKTIGNNKTKTILFMGDFKWIQNRQAAEWIVKEIWPNIQSSVSDRRIRHKSSIKLNLWIVGKHIPEAIKQYASKTIFVDENAPDKTSDIYKKSTILLSPIQVGGGTSYKILEAMASGVPVVTTQLGVEGLGAKDGREALVGKTSEELSAHVVNLLENANLYDGIRKNARALIEEKYSWEMIAKVLEGVYKDAVKEE